MRHLLSVGKSSPGEVLWALRDVSFSVKRGEAFGVIGANGSGKSTLLQIIAGILRPSSGSVEVKGRLSALLELGSGFSPEFSGRDNVYLNGSLLGLSREEIAARFTDIERFAGIGTFIDQPIRTYSTGMVLRLAFAVAAHVDPEILIVDEALAVGDITFRQRCMRRIHDLRARGATILFVSHETSDVKALCERCVWLQNGAVQALGEADEVVAQYLSATLQREISHGPELTKEHLAPVEAPDLVTGFQSPFAGRRFGDGRARIIGADVTGASGSPLSLFMPLEQIVLRISFRATTAVASPIAGFLVRNGKGENIFGSNSARENYPLPSIEAGEANTVQFRWTAPDLAAGLYYISLAISDGNVEEFQVCDYMEDAIEVSASSDSHAGQGYFHLHCAAVTVHWHRPQLLDGNRDQRGSL
jgi:ABC-type polysaccharide/polyol phosphate transport system ATPase subunit